MDSLNDDDFETPSNIELEKCPICERTFVPATLVKHYGICEKMSAKKRKQFDSLRQRIEGTDLALLPQKFERKPSLTKTITLAKKLTPQKSTNSLVKEPIRSVKKTLGPISEQCPHCERNFGIKAYERHVDWCREKSRIQPQTGHGASFHAAKERLDARTRYRAPPLKSKRELNRQKYSGYDTPSLYNSTDYLNRQKSLSPGYDDSRKFMTQNSMTSSTTSEGQEEYEETEEQEKLVRNTKTSSRIPTIPCIYKKQNSSEKLIKRRQIDEDERPIKPTKNYSKHQQEIELEIEKINLTSRSYTVQEKSPSSQINNKKPITRPSCLLLNSSDDLLVVTPYTKNPDVKRNNFTDSPKSPPKVVYSNDKFIRRFNCEQFLENDSSEDEEFKVVTKKKGVRIKKILDDIPFYDRKGLLKEEPEPYSSNHRIDNNDEEGIFKPPFYETKSLEKFKIKTDSNEIIKKGKLKVVENENLTNFERALSDSYDPFQSAKRQLEELFSPTQPSTTTKKVMSTSMTAASPTTKLNNFKSNFTRTLSLRTPKTSKSSLYPSSTKSSIQRGITDDNPISSNFLKSSEFDELPIKTYASEFIASKMVNPTTPIIMRRDTTPTLKRKNLKLDLNLSKTSQPISKTDSLAVFLKYEHDLCTAPSLSEKDMKDKNNCFSKRLSDISSSSLEKSPAVVDLSEIPKYEKIDEKLINLCDNLFIKSDSSSSSSSSSSESSVETPKFIETCNRNSGEQRTLKRQIKLSRDNILYDSQPNIDEYSDKCDKTISLIENLPQQKKKDNMENIFNDFDFDEFISSFEDDEQYPIFKDYKDLMANRNTNKHNLLKSRSKEEILEDDDENFIENEKRSELNNSSDESTTEEVKTPPLLLPPIVDSSNNFLNRREVDEDEEEEEEMRKFEKLEEFSATEKELLKSVQELDRMCDLTPNPADSDETSVDGYPFSRVGSKFSADSAYGSLSRQSPIEPPIRRNLLRSRQTTQTELLNAPTSTSTPKNLKIETQRISRQTSLSSSGSETSLPQLPQITAHKIEIHSHNEKQPPQIMTDSFTKMSKFCHECGTKFLVQTAKFCMDCGVKRVVLE